MSFLLHVLAGLLLAGLIVGLGLVVAFYVVRRRVRRAWSRVQSHVVTRGALAAPSVLADWRDRLRHEVARSEWARRKEGRRMMSTA